MSIAKLAHCYFVTLSFMYDICHLECGIVQKYLHQLDICYSYRSRVDEDFNSNGLLIKMVEEIVILEVFEAKLCFEIRVISVYNLSVFDIMIEKFYSQESLNRRVQHSVFDAQKLVYFSLVEFDAR